MLRSEEEVPVSDLSVSRCEAAYVFSSNLDLYSDAEPLSGAVRSLLTMKPIDNRRRRADEPA